MFNITSGAVVISGVTVRNGKTTGNGGGIYNIDSITITGSTLSGNSADSGGGIFNQNVTASITNSTFSGNGASTGGGIFNASGAVDLTNVIIANSPSGGDCSGSSTSLGHNLDSDDTCGLTDTDDLPGADPLLGPLQNNGGATDTHALRRGWTSATSMASPGLRPRWARWSRPRKTSGELCRAKC